MSHVTVTAADGGRFQAYVAMPRNVPVAAVVVIQEIFGVNKVMRELTDGYAASGYLAICPDLFWRIEPGIDITDQSEAEWQKAFELFGKFDVDAGVDDLVATIAHVRGLPECSGKVATVGYCLGGKLAYLMATRSDADANVSFYGVGLDALTGEAGNISRPYLCHVAENDGFVPREARDRFVPLLNANTHATVHVYAGQDHAFARVGGQHYHQPSADLANQRTAAFFADHLG